MNFDNSKEHGTDVENQVQMAKEKPDIWFEFSHEALKKIDKNDQRHADEPEVFYYQENNCTCLTYGFASVIKYLIREKIIFGVDHLSTDLIEINQQDPQIVQKVNDMMRKNGYFTCKKLKKKNKKK